MLRYPKSIDFLHWGINLIPWSWNVDARKVTVTYVTKGKRIWTSSCLYLEQSKHASLSKMSLTDSFFFSFHYWLWNYIINGNSMDWKQKLFGLTFMQISLSLLVISTLAYSNSVRIWACFMLIWIQTGIKQAQILTESEYARVSMTNGYRDICMKISPKSFCFHWSCTLWYGIEWLWQMLLGQQLSGN